MLRINQILKGQDLSIRILWADLNVAIWIDIYAKTALPQRASVSDIESRIAAGILEPMDDPFLSSILQSPAENTTAWNKRERAWLAIKDIANDERIYYPSTRQKLIAQSIANYGVTKQTVYRHLRRYWQRGQCLNALTPDYKNSGAPGKRRQARGQKLGRPRTISSGMGIVVTLDIERMFRLAIDAVYIDNSKASLRDAYSNALGLVKAHAQKEDPDALPTIWQFRHFYRREYQSHLVTKARATPIVYAKDIRPLHSTSTTEVLGPGSRYQIDATIADVYLVSETDRSLIVGRPVVYFVIDVFSRMVTGLYIGFEGPSWVSAMIALWNTVEDKVIYCRELGIHIETDDWPTQGLPDAILADRGEMLGHHVEVLIGAFSVRVENASAYRGDAKGIVERYFKTIQGKFKPYVDGVVTGEIGKKRGGADYRLDATLTLHEFKKIIVHCVLWHNRYHVNSKYDRDDDMPMELPAVPLQLWDWGIVNRTGRLRTYPEDRVKINLLPYRNATVSEEGIKLFGCLYTCSEAVEQGWFNRKGARRPETVIAAYDPRSADRIYLRMEHEATYWACELIDRSRRFRGMSFWDVWRITKEERKTAATAEKIKDTTRSDLDKTIETIARDARDNKPNTDSLTKAERLGSIRDNRQQEKQRERRQSQFISKPTQQKKSAAVIPIRRPSEEDYRFPDMLDDLFGEEDNE